MGDQKDRIRGIADASRNKRQASLLLKEVARANSEDASCKCAQSDKLMKECKATFEKTKKLRNLRAG